MGAHPWFYAVPYDEDICRALETLREREFRAGRYYPAEQFPRFPVDPNHAPGCKHASIKAARAAAGGNGARSIVDMQKIADRPDFGVVCAISGDELEEFFGSLTPTAEEILESDELFELIERGQGVYAVAYEDGKPVKIIYVGYSFD
jgi:hypothetical protein